MKRQVAIVVVLLLGTPGTWAAAPPDAETLVRFARLKEAERLEGRAYALYRARKFPEAAKVLTDALHVYEELYPKARFPQGHPKLAAILNILGVLHSNQGEYAKAEPPFRRALEMREGIYPKTLFPHGHVELASSLIWMAYLCKIQGEYAKAEPLFHRALQMYEELYPQARFPQGHPDLASCINLLGILHQDQGQYAKAEPLLRRALEMRERLFPKTRFPQGHSALAASLNSLATLHSAQGEYEKAEPLFRRALEMDERLYPKTRFPQGHPLLAAGINNLASLYQNQGEYAKAELLLRRALQMYEELYPQTDFPHGHPDLALGIMNLATLHRLQQEYAKAEPLLRRALQMNEELFPPSRFPHGFPNLALSINNLASVYLDQGEYAKAEPLFRRALQMYEELFPPSRFPHGFPNLATNINNLALVHQVRGEYAKAERLFRRAIQMNEGLFPPARFLHGHPDLAQAINNLARMYQDQREYAKAEPLFRRSLEMCVASATALAAYAPEATSLNYLASLPEARDDYLSVTRLLPEMDAYLAVWQTKAALSRVYERRHLSALAASSKEARVLWNGLLALRRERESLLLAPVNPDRAKARDTRLDAIDEDIRRKEADLSPLLPALKRSNDLARATPDDLRKTLPDGTAFVDLLRYWQIERNPRIPGKKGTKYTPRYVAFVVTRQRVKRIELGEAKPIEETLDLWRRAVVEESPTEPVYSAKVHALLWTPLLGQLPAKASVVYISPNAALNRLPWAALRDGKTGRVLIEDHAVAVLPHGPMLLDRLTAEKSEKETRPTLLAVGGVAYDRKPKTSTDLAMRSPVGDAITWKSLAGTEKELKQIVELAGKRHLVRRTGEEASAATLLADLPGAHAAHLATHGFFADEKFRTIFQLDEKLFRRRFEERIERIGAGSRSPMILSGLVCSGANVAGTPSRGILTAEAIAGLDLRRMNLAVLSACETGLGDVAGGEGVYGLVRAFHIAGARNVAASLWKVDDEATAALMVLFYRHLWGKEPVSAAEALRRAQLAVYREPGRIKEWSQGRGPLPVPLAGSGRAPEKTPAGKTSPAKVWAAFVISGPGD